MDQLCNISEFEVCLIGVISEIDSMSDNISYKIVLSSLKDFNKIQIFCFQINQEHKKFLEVNTIIKVVGHVKNDKNINIIMKVDCFKSENLQVLGLINEKDIGLLNKQRNYSLKEMKFSKLISLTDLYLVRSVMKLDIIMKRIIKFSGFKSDNQEAIDKNSGLKDYENINIKVI